MRLRVIPLFIFLALLERNSLFHATGLVLPKAVGHGERVNVGNVRRVLQKPVRLVHSDHSRHRAVPDTETTHPVSILNQTHEGLNQQAQQLSDGLLHKPMLCNGYVELCDRSYGNVTFLGAHDSFAYSRNPYALARTQEINIIAQLELGVRLLQAQGRMHGNELHFCHTSCLLFDGGPVTSYLKNVKIFLDKHPHEVLTLLFTNPEDVSVSRHWASAFIQTGLASMAFVPNPDQMPMPRTAWPTLRDMITNGKRLVIFLDKGAGSQLTGGRRPVDFILPQFDIIWEDPYSPTSLSFGPCSVDRISPTFLTKDTDNSTNSGSAIDFLSITDHLYLINHNLNANLFPFGNPIRILTSDRRHAPKVNGIDSIIAHARQCSVFAESRAPNFVLLDYVNVGQGVEAVWRLNGLRSRESDALDYDL